MPTYWQKSPPNDGDYEISAPVGRYSHKQTSSHDELEPQDDKDDGQGAKWRRCVLSFIHKEFSGGIQTWDNNSKNNHAHVLTAAPRRPQNECIQICWSSHFAVKWTAFESSGFEIVIIAAKNLFCFTDSLAKTAFPERIVQATVTGQKRRRATGFSRSMAYLARKVWSRNDF